MLAMPLNLATGLAVQDEADRVLFGSSTGSLFEVPNLSSYIIACAQLVGETLTLCVEEETSNTTESLGGKELDFGLGACQY